MCGLTGSVWLYPPCEPTSASKGTYTDMRSVSGAVDGCSRRHRRMRLRVVLVWVRYGPRLRPGRTEMDRTRSMVHLYRISESCSNGLSGASAVEGNQRTRFVLEPTSAACKRQLDDYAFA